MMDNAFRRKCYCLHEGGMEDTLVFFLSIIYARLGGFSWEENFMTCSEYSVGLSQCVPFQGCTFLNCGQYVEMAIFFIQP